MAKRILLCSDRPSFEAGWRRLLVAAGLDSTRVGFDDLTTERVRNRGVLIDAGSFELEEDDVIAAVALSVTAAPVVAVHLPDGAALEVEDLLSEICRGLVWRGAPHQAAATALGRRLEVGRGQRFEFLTVSPDGRHFVAVFGDARCRLIERPAASLDTGADVASIELSEDAQSAHIGLGDGVAFTLKAGEGQATPDASVAGSFSSVVPDALLEPINGIQLGLRLRALRQEAGLTQAELAKRTGIHRPNIARVEAGRHTPSLETITRLASAIGVAPAQVLSRN